MLNELAAEIHENAKAKGFYNEPKNTGEMLCLIHSEVSEALEADRKDSYTAILSEMGLLISHTYSDEDFKKFYEENIKRTFQEEMADIIIRVLDLCEHKKIDIDKHVHAKMKYNSLREFKHGGKKY